MSVSPEWGQINAVFAFRYGMNPDFMKNFCVAPKGVCSKGKFNAG